jgi:hypothetical protein
MPIQCYSSIVLALVLLVLSVVNGSWEGVGASLALGAVGAALLPFALRIQRRREEEGPDSIWRERRGVWERVETPRPMGGRRKGRK